MKKTFGLSRVSNRQGQNMVEYMMLFVVIILVVFVGMGPGGFFRKSIANSLNTSVSGIEFVANGINIQRYK